MQMDLFNWYGWVIPFSLNEILINLVFGIVLEGKIQCFIGDEYCAF